MKKDLGPSGRRLNRDPLPPLLVQFKRSWPNYMTHMVNINQ